MKILIFFIVVLVSGYYLLSKTDNGSAIFSRYLPQQQIDKASEELLKNVDDRLQEVTTKFSLEQKQGLQQLEQRFSALHHELGQQLAALKEQQAQGKAKQPAPGTNKNTNENKTLALPAQAKQGDENDQVKARLAHNNEATLAQDNSNDKDDERKALQRQKQASLQFITSRMEQMAVKVSSGTY